MNPLRRCIPLTAIWLYVFASILPVALGAVRTYNFNLTYGFWSADCVKKQVILINGAYPGPTIEATEGDIVRINVRNELVTEGVSIHWHGIRQFKTVFMDGAAYVSECPIPSLSTFQYRFNASKAGTFMYHAHHGLQSAAGLYGKFIVHEKEGKFPYNYDSELSFITNDWYHRPINEMAAGLSSIPFLWIGDPQAIVINGKGKYNCSLIPTQSPVGVPGGAVSGDVLTCNAADPQCAREVFYVKPGKTYRLRISNVATLNLHNVKIEGHNVTVIMADQYLVDPFTVDSFDIYSGQTMDVLFTASNVSGNYWISVAVRGRNSLTPKGLAILNVAGVVAAEPLTQPPTHAVWNDAAYSTGQVLAFKALPASKGGEAPPVPKKSSRQLILVNTQQRHQGYLLWSLNNVSHSLPSTPVFHAIKSRRGHLLDQSTPPDVPDYVYDYTQLPPYTETKRSDHVYFFKRNQVVDIVLQNANTLTPNVSEYHPWHMHGHHFWVLGSGNGTFTQAVESKFNLVDPHYRNTVAILPYGWTAIRFIADNPGAWFFHCHVIAHHYMGMSIVFAVGRKDGRDMPNIPRRAYRCGELN